MKATHLYSLAGPVCTLISIVNQTLPVCREKAGNVCQLFVCISE